MTAERREQVTREEIEQGQRATGGTRRFRRKVATFKSGTSRMNREVQVRICERLGVKFPGPTRLPIGVSRKKRPSNGPSPRDRILVGSPLDPIE